MRRSNRERSCGRYCWAHVMTISSCASVRRIRRRGIDGPAVRLATAIVALLSEKRVLGLPMTSLIPAKIAARRLGCSEVVFQQIAYSSRLPITVATATRTWWIPEDALAAYEVALAERDDR